MPGPEYLIVANPPRRRKARARRAARRKEAPVARRSRRRSSAPRTRRRRSGAPRSRGFLGLPAGVMQATLGALAGAVIVPKLMDAVTPATSQWALDPQRRALLYGGVSFGLAAIAGKMIGTPAALGLAAGGGAQAAAALLSSLTDPAGVRGMGELPSDITVHELTRGGLAGGPNAVDSGFSIQPGAIYNPTILPNAA
jgi:hypothetical protein